MITPLGQRQVFQTAHVEALRQAHEVHEQVQREAARQKVAEDRLSEGAHEVHEVPHSDQIRTEERHGRQQQQAPEDHGEGEPKGEGGPEAEGAHPAPPAEGHLDLLA